MYKCAVNEIFLALGKHSFLHLTKLHVINRTLLYYFTLKTFRVFLLFHYWFLVENEVETDEKLLFKESSGLYISYF